MGKYKAKPEKRLQNEVLKYLNLLGIFCWHAKNGGTFDPIRQVFRRNCTMKGVADIIGIIPDDGRILAIELKSKTGVVSPEQRLFLDRIKRDGGISGVARSIDDVKQILEQACLNQSHTSLQK